MYTPQQTRTLAVTSDAWPSWAGQNVLLPQRVSGTEALGKLYEYRVELATLDCPTCRLAEAKGAIHPDGMIGKAVTISVEFEGKGTFIPGLPGDEGAGNVGAGVREITGLITAMESTGSDDRRAYYRITVRPWLWLATRNCESRIFQNMSVVEVTETVLKGENYRFPYDMRLGALGLNHGVYPKRDFIRQHWESDYKFLTRIWREWGIYFLFDGLTLVLCDSPGSHKRHHNCYDAIPYHAPDGNRIDEEHIHRLKLARRITAGDVTLNDYDYTRSRARFDVNRSQYSDSTFDNAEQYRWGDYSQPMAGAMGLTGTPNDYRTEGEYLAGVRAYALRGRKLRAYGEGNLRGLTTGKIFRLEGHPDAKANAEYLVVETTIDLRNVDEASRTTDSAAQYQCVTGFVAQPANTLFKNRLRKRPRANPETAVVTAPEGHPVWLDGYARIKVQFAWDREGQGDQNSSCWVRVSLPWHGGPHSFIAVPRTGDEVTIGYHEGDPDKPYVAASKVNQFNQPPFELPKNQALTGLVSNGLDGRGHNYVVTDDTPGELQVQVASEQANSRLVLGYNTRIDYREGRQQARGLGWELATDAWGVLRANGGMLVTTERRDGAGAPATDRGETLQRLAQAREQHDVLANAAVQAFAHASQDRVDISEALKTQSKELEDAAPADGKGVPGMTTPHLVLASAADIAHTAAGNVNVHSNVHTVITTGAHLAVSTGSNLLASARNAIRLFAYQLGIRMVSYAEDINVQALKKSINLLAKLDITQTANRITIKAAEEVMLHGGDSYISLKSGKITVGGGVYEVNAQSRNLPPKPMGVSVNGLPDVQANDQRFRLLSPAGTPLPGVDYAIRGASGGHVFRTDAEGFSPRVNTEHPENVEFELHWDEFLAASRTDAS